MPRLILRLEQPAPRAIYGLRLGYLGAFASGMAPRGLGSTIPSPGEDAGLKHLDIYNRQDLFFAFPDEGSLQAAIVHVAAQDWPHEMVLAVYEAEPEGISETQCVVTKAAVKFLREIQVWLWIERGITLERLLSEDVVTASPPADC